MDWSKRTELPMTKLAVHNSGLFTLREQARKLNRLSATKGRPDLGFGSVAAIAGQAG